ncbi:MAG: integrase core domain-containing protein, partial [Actinobacteria bacterium]|nr:integrase core domain-containing protein [Actinomycetota bacterium]
PPNNGIGYPPTEVGGLRRRVSVRGLTREYAFAEERRSALTDFLNHYNHERPHASLGHLVE